MTTVLKLSCSQLLILFSMILVYTDSFSATGNGSNGNWNLASTWSFGGVNRIPACGDTLIIPANVIITVNSQEDYSACSLPIVINIQGVLEFANGNKIMLPCSSSVTLLPNGNVRKAGSGGGSSSYIHICNCVAWQASQGQVIGPGNLNCSVLPVSLLSFTASHKDDFIRLNWSTASEINNDHFSLERAGSDLVFYPIAFVKGHGNSNSTIGYSFNDHDELTGILYYRLRQVDFNGTSVYSDVIAVRAAATDKFALNPTISDGGSLSLIYCNVPSLIRVIIFNVNGQQLYSTELPSERNLTSKIPIIFSSGEYIIYSVSGDEELKTRFRVP
jgi:hypothetical protein